MEHIAYKDTIPFIPPLHSGKVVKVYDGDTITVATTLPYENSPYYRFSVRLKGIDCPELRTTNSSEKECALLAREFTTKLLLNKMVLLKDVELEKYGRILANVFYEDNNISDVLCEARLAVKYDGGKKQSPENWMDYHKN
jgi:micrococcal nuclease